MSDINEKTIEHVAKLCHLPLSAEEMTVVSQEIEAIVEYIEQVEFDLHIVAQTALQQPCTLRLDEVKAVLTTEDYLKNAPDVLGSMIKIPPILKS